MVLARLLPGSICQLESTSAHTLGLVIMDTETYAPNVRPEPVASAF